MIPNRWIRIASIFALAGFSGFTLLYSSGITGLTKKPSPGFFQPGCLCHGDTASPLVSARIEGPESVAAGRQAVYRLLLNGDSALAGGFNVAAYLGILGIAESSATQLLEPAPGLSPELTHTQPRSVDSAGGVAWEFHYRAPFAAGIVDTLYANGNLVNLNGDPTGDVWTFAPNFTVTVVPVTGVEEQGRVEEFRLDQNYPNPFNPSTTVTVRLQERAVIRLSIADLAGRTVEVLASGSYAAGAHAFRFDARDLASGVYLAVLAAQTTGGTASLVRKMVLAK